MRRLTVILVTGLALVLAGASQALAGPAGPPGKPENVAVTLTYDAVSMSDVFWNLTWAPPATDGGAPITGYEVYFGDETTPTFMLGSTTQTSFGMVVQSSVWELNGSSLYVRAVSGAEYGSGSHFSSTTVGKSAGPPQNVAVTPGLASLAVSWAPAAAGDYPIASYVVRVVGEGSVGECVTAATSCTVSNLVNGTSYSVRVSAKDVNGILGTAAAPAGVFVVGLAPGPPTAVAASAAANKVTVTWKAPASDGGLPITKYRATSSKGGASCETKTLSCSMTLAYGSTYTFTVKAFNAKGESIASAPSKPVTLKKLQQASFKVPKKVKSAGTTVLLTGRVTTNAGRRAHVAVTVEPRGTRFATVSTTPKGKTSIAIKGHHRLRVTMRLWAPGTKKYGPFRYVKVWKVKG